MLHYVASELSLHCLLDPFMGFPVGQAPTALAVGASGGCLDIFTLIYHFSFLSLSLLDGPI